ncbi:hypothetical protein QQ054_22440 [Oscillatoria amoena NRMC-F 0135]|nr:hypothetical protein [Oscillatoria amoena NRMC-F 0135]
MTIYKPSGKFSPVALPYYIGAGSLLFPILAFLYAYAIWYCPFVYVNIIITAAFGAAMGGTLGYIVEKAKVRNFMIGVFFAIASSLLAYCIHWVVWVDLAINAGHVIGDDRIASVAISNVSVHQLYFLFTNPAFTQEIIKEINTVGIWGLGGSSDLANGGLLSFIWLLEAGIIFLLAIKLGTEKIRQPFSEKTNTWIAGRSLAMLEYINNPHDFKAKLLKGDTSILQDMRKSDGLEDHTAVKLFDSGAQEYYLSFTNRELKENKGKIEFKDSVVIPALVADEALIEMIRQKPKYEPITPQKEGQDTIHDSVQEQVLYDINKTKIVVGLLQVPPDQRDEQWHTQYHANILNAAFTCGNPQVVTGPDGFPYFMLKYPEPQKKFNPFSLQSIKDHVLKNGFGVALSPDGQQVIWSIPYGAMVNLHVNGELFSASEHTDLPEKEILTQSTKILTAQPSEEYLPKVVREVIKDFFQAQGIAEPRVMLMMRSQQEGVTSELVFNIYAEDFESEEAFESLMNMVKWFLPRHYMVTSVSRQATEPETMVNL